MILHVQDNRPISTILQSHSLKKCTNEIQKYSNKKKLTNLSIASTTWHTFHPDRLSLNFHRHLPHLSNTLK